MGNAPVLLGVARGDHTVPGIGDKKLSEIKSEERTTPAGRFVAEVGTNARGEDVVWVDYDSAVSMHRVLTTNAKEQRARRLQTPTPNDNRVSYGCINVPERLLRERGEHERCAAVTALCMCCLNRSRCVASSTGSLAPSPNLTTARR